MFELLPAQAMHSHLYSIVGNTLIGEHPKPEHQNGNRRGRGNRGKDRQQERRKRRCGFCIRFSGKWPHDCAGRCSRSPCEYFDKSGKAIKSQDELPENVRRKNEIIK